MTLPLCVRSRFATKEKPRVTPVTPTKTVLVVRRPLKRTATTCRLKRKTVKMFRFLTVITTSCRCRRRVDTAWVTMPLSLALPLTRHAFLYGSQELDTAKAHVLVLSVNTSAGPDASGVVAIFADGVPSGDAAMAEVVEIPGSNNSGCPVDKSLLELWENTAH